MKEWLHVITDYAIVIIDTLALLFVLIGTAETAVAGIRDMFSSPTAHNQRGVWLRFARWLVAGLTFQLAADIIETSITTSWEAVGRLGAIAIIRTFLNYFLERDLAEVRARQTGRERDASHTPIVPLGDAPRRA